MRVVGLVPKTPADRLRLASGGPVDLATMFQQLKAAGLPFLSGRSLPKARMCRVKRFLPVLLGAGRALGPDEPA